MAQTQFTAKIELSRALEKQMEASMVGFTTSAVEALAAHFKFDSKEAIKLLGLEKVEVTRKTVKPKSEKAPKAKKEKSVQLPFVGVCIQGCCEGIRLNHNLYTQCTMEKEGDTRFCKTCNKQCDANSNNLPNYGDVQDRIQRGNEWRDPKGKMPAHYGNVMQKLSITREAAEAEAKKVGITIPEEMFEVRVAKKGRPKKSVAASDTESEASAKAKEAPKKRGRPKKVKTVVAETAPGDDLIASLVKEAKAGDSDSVNSEGEAPVAKVEVKPAEPAKKKAGRPKVQRTPEEEAAHKAKLAEARKARAAAKKEQEEGEAKLVAEAKAAAEAKAKEEAEAKAKKEAEIKAKTTDESDYATNSDATVDELNAAAGAVVCDLGALDNGSDLEEEEVEEGEEIECIKFEHKGKEYYKTADGVLYDPETSEAVGIFNAETNEIDELPDDSD